MIINSLLDTDFYKFTISQYAWKHHNDVIAKFEFMNRSNIELRYHIDIESLDEEIEHLGNLRFTDDEILYLESLYVFDNQFLKELKELDLSKCINVIYNATDFRVESSGLWWEASLAETFVLSIINELYINSFNKFTKKDLSLIHHDACIDSISSHRNTLQRYFDNGDYNTLVDFGTRRRAGYRTQEYVNSIFSNLPFFSGTSNVFFSRMFGTNPIGTYAHEIPMIIGGLFLGHGKEVAIMKQQEILDKWKEMYYPETPLIALPDTFGSNHFFDHVFTKDRAEKWNGIRHDSGDPKQFGYKVIEFYESYGIDPKTKSIVFSDGLDINNIIDLYREFSKKINVKFGWGTNLTNNGIFKPLSIVMKPTMTMMNSQDYIHPVIKFSDDKGKISNKNKNTLQKFSEVYEYEIK